jgi:DNA invertase Pin-like site-specific DNA recombinase
VTVAAYVRVSSRSQDVRSQRDAIGRCAAARGDDPASWYVENWSATKSLDRPALNELRAAVRAGLVRTVYVFRLDRFARSGIRDMLTVLEELRGAGCKVVSVADGFDLEGPFREVIAAVMAWVAQMEGAARGERVAAARVRVEAAGGNWGRPARASDELAARVREMKSSRKMTIRKIAIALKIPKSTVGVILSRKGAYDPARSTSRKTARKKS